MDGFDLSQARGLHLLRIVRDDGASLDDRVHAALRLGMFHSIADVVLAEAANPMLPDKLGRAMGMASFGLLQHRGLADEEHFAGLHPEAELECLRLAERLRTMPNWTFPPAPTSKRSGRKVQNLTEPTASRLLVYCDLGSPLLGVYDVDARALKRISTVCDNSGVAIDDVIERVSWFATTANGVVCSLPKALDGPGKMLCRSWRTAPGADPELLWVQHPKGADRSVAIDSCGTVHAERGAPVPAADLGETFIEDGTAIAGVVPFRQQTFVTRSGFFNVNAAGVQRLGADGSVLGFVVPEGLTGDWVRASASPDGSVLCVIGRLELADPAESGARWGIWLVELPALRVQRVEDELSGWPSQPVWSLDGMWIFVGGEVTPTEGLWAISVDKRTLHLVAMGVQEPWPLAALGRASLKALTFRVG